MVKYMKRTEKKVNLRNVKYKLNLNLVVPIIKAFLDWNLF